MKILKNLITNPFTKAVQINRDVIIKLLKPHKGKILEIGPGYQPILQSLRHINDKDKYVLEFAGVAEHCKNLGYKCYEQDVRVKWKIKSNSFDIIVSNQCLEHIYNTDHFIQEAHRVLKPNGIFLVSVPNQGALAFIFLMLLTINPPMNCVSDLYYSLGNPLSKYKGQKREAPGQTHLRLFMPRAMNELLFLHGFKVIKNHGGSWGIPLIGRFLGSIFPYYGLYTTVLSKKFEKQNT
ncbi:MAG: class I SAM-dependent methyltransferase [Spirochaetia bacterium]|nr:class I SAM-dependent methyltransferase [Spirochaetia bacterium]